MRDGAARVVGASVESYLEGGKREVEDLANAIRIGACRVDSPEAVAPCLSAELLRDDNLVEATFTSARRQGYEDDGTVRLFPANRWQVSAFRSSVDSGAAPCLRSIERAGEGYQRSTECAKARDAYPRLSPASAREPAPDPTAPLSFLTPLSGHAFGRTLSTDLAYADLDEGLPEGRRRIVLSFLKGVADEQGGLLGVVRLSLDARTINERVREVQQRDVGHARRIFLFDENNRLVTPLGDRDAIQSFDDDLRYAPVAPPEEVTCALALPASNREFDWAGQTYFFDVKELPASLTQGWRIGIVDNESNFLEAVRRTQQQWLVLSIALFAIVMGAGVLVLRSVRRGLSGVAAEATKMRDFDFTPSARLSSFADVNAVLATLEHTKTALRALGKYAPLPLVRELYQANREPTLGGELRETCIMFTDIQDFTQLSERYPPDRLARILGAYLEVMTRAVHAHDGVVDKYVGDAVMALWNAARPCPEPARQACLAALACTQATRALYEDPHWDGPPLVTRFGIHIDRVMVGHFGAPDRMSFTALGDGVNLASRLEGLNKQYGTRILVSQAVRERAGAGFRFRRLDRVAVKGKAQAVDVHELLEPTEGGLPEATAAYEAALDAYLARDFGGAMSRLAPHLERDRPSAVLHARCQRFSATPPPDGWDGTHVAMEK